MLPFIGLSLIILTLITAVSHYAGSRAQRVKTGKLVWVLAACSVLFLFAVCASLQGQSAAAPKAGKQTVFYASQSGAQMDCIVAIEMGTPGTLAPGWSGSNCTDNTAVLNSYLVSVCATYTNILFEVDGGSILTSTLLKPHGCNVNFQGTDEFGSGFVMTSGDNYTVLCDAPTSTVCKQGESAGTPPSQSGTLEVSNLTINGARAAQDNCSIGCFGIYADSDIRVDLDHVNLYDTRAFAYYSSNIGWQQLVNGRITEPNLLSNQDGLHPSGPNGGGVISNWYIKSGDDSIAINAPESWGGNTGPFTISGVVEDGSLSFLRAYGHPSSGTDRTVGPLMISNVTGTVAEGAFQLCGFNSGSTTPDQIQPIHAANVYLSSTANSTGGARAGMLEVCEPVGEFYLANSSWTPLYSASGAAPFQNFSSAATISNETLVNDFIYQTSAGPYASDLATVPSGSVIKTLEINGFGVRNQQGQTWSAISYLLDVQSGGAIVHLIDDAVDWSLITTMFKSSGGSGAANVTSLTGSGVGTIPGVVALTGCTSAALGAGAIPQGGTITGTPTGACAATLTFALPAAPHGWACGVANNTHPGSTNLMGQSAFTTSTAVFSGTTIASDVLTYSACSPW
jgi:hypothetical protein